MRFVYTYNKSASKPGDSREILAPQRNVLGPLPGTTRNPDLAGRKTVISATFPEKTQERLDSFPAPGLPHPERGCRPRGSLRIPKDRQAPLARFLRCPTMRKTLWRGRGIVKNSMKTINFRSQPTARGAKVPPQPFAQGR